MNEVFENIILQFASIRRVIKNDEDLEWNRAVYKCTEIVRQAAGCNNGWIPCSERLPKEYGDYLVAWKPLSMSADDIIKKVGRVVPHFYEIVEYDPDDEALWIGSIEQAKGEYEIIAWQPLPAPYQPSGDHKKKTNFDKCCESMEAMAQIIDIAKIGWTKEQIIEWLQKEECPVPDWGYSSNRREREL